MNRIEKIIIGGLIAGSSLLIAGNFSKNNNIKAIGYGALGGCVVMELLERYNKYVDRKEKEYQRIKQLMG